jgi:hypothetical protein
MTVADWLTVKIERHVMCMVGVYKMAIIELNVKRFLVCSTGEDVDFPEPEDSLEAAIAMRDKNNEDEDNDEGWDIVAEVDA